MSRLAARLTSDADSDGVVHAALARAWRTRSEWDENHGSVQAWLLSIVVDRARRRRRRERSRSLDLGRTTELDPSIAALPAEPRLAVELFYLLGLGLEECAEVMQVRVETVTSALARARRQLRTGVEEIDLG